MAKRIITNGKYTKITCACGCVFSFDETDIDENGKVTCPECGAENTPTVKK